MISSNNRKLALSGWLKDEDCGIFSNTLKLQKFLFLYEVLSKAEGDTSDFLSLQGWRNGPVFSKVWGDYHHEDRLFIEAASQAYSTDNGQVNKDRAKRCKYIVQVLNENDLINLTHSMNIWNIKRSRIESNEKGVQLSENDLSEKDIDIVLRLKKAYPIALIDNTTVVSIGSKNFIFSIEDWKCLTEQHYDTLSILTDDQYNLENPIFARIDGDRVIILD